MPGQRWRDAIQYAIRSGALFVACFSQAYLSRGVSYMNEELTVAIEELRRRPTSSAWFIPASIDGSAIPSRSVGAGETLSDLQWIDLSANWNEGVDRIAQVAGVASAVGNASQALSTVVFSGSATPSLAEQPPRADASLLAPVGGVAPQTDAILEQLPNGWLVKCAMCNESGIKPGYQNTNCPSCDGAGSRRLTMPANADHTLQWSVVGCGYCAGRGIKPGYSETLCHLCDGRGVHGAAFPRRQCAKCKGKGIEPGYSETPCRSGACLGVGTIFVGAIP